MNFAALPPEVNSGLMYAGPGSGPLLAAAAAWDGLAEELHTAATSYQSVISGLTSESWSGPSSVAMATAVAPYVVWLLTTGTGAEKTATQAKVAASAYEAAFAMTVPPSVVAANRTQLMVLVATNFLGQNAPAIAATEAQYGEMWAQDVAAMNGYAAVSATAVEVKPFDPPPQIADPAGSLGQATAVEQASGSTAATGAQAPSQLASALQGLASPASVASTQAMLPESLLELLGILADELSLGVALPLSIVAFPLSVISIVLAGEAMYYAELDSREILEAQDMLAGGQFTILEALAEMGASASVSSATSSSLSAGLGQAISAGNLSVPPSWATAAPEIRTTTYASPAAPSTAAAPAGIATAFSQMALAGMVGSALGGAVGRARQESAGSTNSERPEPPQGSAELPQRSSEPPQQAPAISVAEMAADIRELGQLRDSGLLTEAEFAEQKRRLLSR